VVPAAPQRTRKHCVVVRL